MPPENAVEGMFTKIEGMISKQPWLAAAIAILIIAVGAFWFGSRSGYERGSVQVQSEVASPEDNAKQAATDAAKSANPFQAVNPLEGVEVNPFNKVKKTLNPFEN